MTQKEHMPSRKEWFYLGILVLLTVGVGAYIVHTIGKYEQLGDKKKNTKNTGEYELEISFDEEKQKNIRPIVFEEKKYITKDILDSKGLTTEGYYYLIHRILSMSEEEVERQTDKQLTWRNLIKMAERDKLRGKFMRIKGELVKLEKEVLKGKYADERKFKGLTVWRGVLFSSDGRVYLFTMTEPPLNISLGDVIEVNAMFFKIWIYETSLGGQAKNPYFIGKNVILVPPKNPVPHRKIIIVFLFVFAITCVLLGYGIMRERIEAKKFKESYTERKLQRLKKKHGKKVDSSEKEEEIN